MCVDLPFRHAFRHSAATRATSESLFLKCVTDTGAVGFGESLPREYVTGETRDGSFALLREAILPRLIGMEFDSMVEVFGFLSACDGKSPPEWVSAQTPQTAAWCVVDLALLDAFGCAFEQPVRLAERALDDVALRYGGVVSASAGWKLAISLLKLRAYGLMDVKLKVGKRDVVSCARLARRILPKRSTLRVDANMAWTVPEALERIQALERVGVQCVEQPLPASDLEGQARLVRETHTEIMADESFNDGASLELLVNRRACTGINVRISKCGGLVAAARRCNEALSAGLTIQIGCQVGESSLLSAAQLILLSATPQAQYLEGCYGKHLLREDPVHPGLQFSRGGRPPKLPEGAGLGVRVNEKELNRWTTQHAVIELPSISTKGKHHVTHR
jgi:muconate cycloisomerase